MQQAMALGTIKNFWGKHRQVWCSNAEGVGKANVNNSRHTVVQARPVIVRRILLRIILQCGKSWAQCFDIFSLTACTLSRSPVPLPV